MGIRSIPLELFEGTSWVPPGNLAKKLARGLVSVTVNQLRQVAVSHKLFSGSILSNPRVWALLERIDAAEAERSRSAGCPRCGGALLEPLAERAIGLIAQPAPRHLDEEGADPGRAVTANPLVPLRVPARPRGRRQPDPACELTAVAEAAIEDLVLKQRRVVRADALQLGLRRNLGCRLLLASLRRGRCRDRLALADNRISLGLNFRDLPLHQ